MMRAAILKRVGQPPVPGEAAEPARASGQALVRVAAAPLNPIDLSIGGGRFYAGPPNVPYVPGQEGVGTVLEGESLAPGTRVWFVTGAGYEGDGALAEKALALEERAVELPKAIDDALASCLGVAGLAAWLALEWRAELREGETALVLGASGAVGQIGVQAAKLMGAARVVAAARDEEALGRARALGADATVRLTEHSTTDELAGALREAAGGEIHVTLDPLWGEPAVAAAKAAAPFGRLVHVGQSASPDATLPSAAVRGKSLAILGHSNHSAPHGVVASAYRRMCELAAGGRLTVDHEVLPLERVTEAWERQAEHPHRKLVLRP